MGTTIYDIISIIYKNRKYVLIIVIIFTVISTIISFLMPVKYKATAVLMPPVNQSVSIMSIALRGNLYTEPEVGGVGYMPGMITPSDVFAYMLNSGTVRSLVINECSLIEHYNKRTLFQKNPEKALYEVEKKFKKEVTISVTDEHFILISVEDKNKFKAAEIANKYGDVLDRIYTKMNMTQGGKMREFIEKRLEEESNILNKLEDSLKIFQKRHGTVSLDNELRAVVELTAQIEAKIISQKIEYEAMKTYSKNDNPQLKALETQIDKAKQQLDSITRGSRSGTLFIPYKKAPDIGIELGKRMRDVKIHQEVYALLVQQLEQAKIMEAKDTPKIQFLERAHPPYKKSWPKRSIIIIVGFILGLISSASSLLFKHWWNQYRADNIKCARIRALFEK